MTRDVTVAISIAIGVLLAPSITLGAQRVIVQNVAVGRNLEANAEIGLAEPAPDTGLQLTLTSDDPTKLLLSDATDKAGTETIVLTVRPRASVTPAFFLQGLADSGTVTYAVSAPSLGSTKGTATLLPSALVILGPSKTPSFTTTPRGFARDISVVTALLDSARKVVVGELLAGGQRLEVNIISSNPEVGKLGTTKLELAGGTGIVGTTFTPAAVGTTTMSLAQPPGFSTPAQYESVTAVVQLPGLAPVTEIYVGKDLQYTAILALGEPAPPGGLKVELKSSDGSKLVISDKGDQLGSASLTLNVPEGKQTAEYYLQGLSDSGVVTYSARAPGFRGRDGRIGLAPSGVIIAYEKLGPPDHKNISTKGPVNDDRRFYVNLSDAKSQAWKMLAWTVWLDPEVGRGADVTIQPLRAGVSLTVDLQSSDPAVGTIESPVTIKSGESWTSSRFTALSKGETIITVSTPKGFTKSKNATAVPAVVSQ